MVAILIALSDPIGSTILTIYMLFWAIYPTALPHASVSFQAKRVDILKEVY
jgi:hypothetical protein